MRKGGNVDINTITSDDYITLLPEYYLRPYSPHYITEEDFMKQLHSIEEEMRSIFNEIS